MAMLPPDPVHRFKEDMGYIHCLCFWTRGNNDYVSHILAATEKGIVYFWDLETNRLQHKQKMGNSIQAIHCVNFNIITQDKAGFVNLWSVRGSKYEITDSRDCSGGYCKSILFEGSLIIAKEDGCIEILQVYNLQKVKELKPNKEGLGHIMILDQVLLDNKVIIIAGYETGHLVIWNMETSECYGFLKVQEHLLSLTFDPETRRGICGNTSETLQVFSINNDYKMELKAEVSMTNDGCNVLKLRRPESKIMLAGCSDGKIRVYSWRTLRVLAALSGHNGPVTDIQCSPCKVNFWKAKIFAASGADGVISLWNVYN
ncbi:guanine nucleotide-binding protein subunit beta-like protein 1 [Leptinotarsa decemlineata]|uniref:guanine nucleotide-binding protein subunit beta-like protein 1 n=1 Tax=Leptinotarsa decemlineata TaxID=7539 RepID=UPI000C254ACC|nr:guanine nucleotide-binding protein subunit beta-like protein 1 [Leptinotarsa decemlineata]